MASVTGGDRLEVVLKGIARSLATADTVRIGFLEGATYPQGSTKSIRAKYAKRQAKGKKGAIKGGASSEINVDPSSPVTSSTTSVPMVAAVQEFGSGDIPPRPFFRNMIAAKSGEWGPAIADLMRDNDYNSRKVLAITGEAVSGQLRKSIVDFSGVPLKPATIKRKGFDKQLVDTSHMLQSVDYEVE